MAEYSRMASGSFTSTANLSQAIYLPFVPDQVQVWNLTGINHPATSVPTYAMWNQYMAQGDASGYRSLTVATTPAVTSLVGYNFSPLGIYTFNSGTSPMFGATVQIASITKANPAVVTTAANHGYSTGDVVIFEGLPGMLQMTGIPFLVTVTSVTSFTVLWNTNQSNYTAVSGSPAGATVKKILFPFMYAPGKSIISSISLGVTTTVFTTAPHNMVVGQEVAFRIPPAWGAVQFNSLPNSVIPGSPVYGYVTSVTNPQAVVVNINSSAFTAFTTNVPLASVPGLTSPQFIAVGDVNTGGLPYSGGNLYPSPVVNGISTINGPAINGAFVNNSRMGFIITGAAIAGSPTTTSGIINAANQAIYWEASLHDYSSGTNFAANP